MTLPAERERALSRALVFLDKLADPRKSKRVPKCQRQLWMYEIRWLRSMLLTAANERGAYALPPALRREALDILKHWTLE